jgi:hypothetical protein
MAGRVKLDFPLPKIPWSTWENVDRDAAFTLYVDPFSTWGGVLSKRKVKKLPHVPRWLFDQFVTWALVQMERKRIGLPYLEEWEMEIRQGGFAP